MPNTEKPSLAYRLVIFYGLALLAIVLDQLSKSWADTALSYGRPLEVFSFFNLTLQYNTGAAFSFLADAGGWQRYFFTGVAVLVSVVLFVWIARIATEQRLLATALSLVLGGAIGNVIDRILHGHVIDFLSFHWGGSYFPAFNIADSAITLGAGLMIFDMILHPETK